jgi:hypothetical protein
MIREIYTTSPIPSTEDDMQKAGPAVAVMRRFIFSQPSDRITGK